MNGVWDRGTQYRPRVRLRNEWVYAELVKCTSNTRTIEWRVAFYSSPWRTDRMRYGRHGEIKRTVAHSETEPFATKELARDAAIVVFQRQVMLENWWQQ